MPVDPFMWLRLRPAGRRIFPRLLPTKWRQVEKSPKAPKLFVATPGGEIAAKDPVAVAQIDAGARPFTIGGRYSEVGVEVAVRGREPRHAPPHTLRIHKNVGQRRPRNHRDRRVAGLQMAQVSDIVSILGTALTPRRGPTADVGGKHEVIKNKLASPVK